MAKSRLGMIGGLPFTIAVPVPSNEVMSPFHDMELCLFHLLLSDQKEAS